jgi:transposase InsO family protein
MNTVTQNMLFRQALIKYSQKYGVTKAAIRYKTNRQYIYRWLKRYDGTIQSLADKSHRPHHHPNQHTEAEIKLITDMRRRNPNAGLVVFWVKLRQRGYTRSITGLYRVLKKMGEMAVKLRNPKYIPKEYEKMRFPGQRVQIDVKVVPASCIVGESKGEKFYQYTAIDEYSRFRYIAAFKEQSSHSSEQFINQLVKAFKFPIHCVQTDNGQEFTYLRETARIHPLDILLSSLGIEHKLIRPRTPRHNGKVERSHRNDSERFYRYLKFYSYEDLQNQMKKYLYRSNRIASSVLNWMTPIEKRQQLIKDGLINYIK